MSLAKAIENPNQNEWRTTTKTTHTQRFNTNTHILYCIWTSSHSYVEIKILLQIYFGLLSRIAIFVWCFVDIFFSNFGCIICFLKYFSFLLSGTLRYPQTLRLSIALSLSIYTNVTVVTFPLISRTLKDTCKCQDSFFYVSLLLLCSSFNSICQVNRNQNKVKVENTKTYSFFPCSFVICIRRDPLSNL